MKIKGIFESCILFDDDSEITSTFDEAGYGCNVYNWADFSQLDKTALDVNFPEDLKFESCEYGFRFGFGNCMFFIPCYSSQNGYYSDTVTVLYRDRIVLEDVSAERA